MPATLTTTAPVWTLNLGDDENRFSPDWLTQVDEALATVRDSSEPIALCITGSGKFFSNGLDLDWLQPMLVSGRPMWRACNRSSPRR